MGRLIYVVGASGVGKDTLLQSLRMVLLPEDKTIVAHRYITRPAHIGNENHIALSQSEFQWRLASDCFALAWSSYDNFYGIGRELDDWLARGLTVLVNGSRAYFAEAKNRYPAIELVQIIADEATIQQRLQARGRDSQLAITERVQRNHALAVRSDAEVALTLDNTGTVAQSLENFLAWLRTPR